jgi:hypothetical protein
MTTTFHGTALIATWTYGTSGTLVINTGYRSLTYDPTVDKVDVTSGPDGQHSYMMGAKDGKANFTFLQASKGTQILTAFVEGQLGTLKWQPEGMAATYPVHTAAFYSDGIKHAFNYAGEPVFSCDLQQTGARTDGTN